MSKIIGFLNGKGGVGKTTTTINVATCLTRKGFKVAVVDTDPQLSIVNWHDAEKSSFDVAEAQSEKEVYSIKKSIKGYDFILIDGAAAISAISAAAVMVSDLVLIPLTPSPLDFAASAGILAVIEARKELKPIIARFLITKKIFNASMTAVLHESIADTGLEALRAGTTQRQVYVKTMLDGGTVYDTTDGKAKGEIDVLTNEILELLK